MMEKHGGVAKHINLILVDEDIKHNPKEFWKQK